MGITRWWRRTRWRIYAPVYDWVASPLEGARERAVERLDLGPDDKILIVGCGTGMDLEYFPSSVSVNAIDIVQTNLHRTEKKAEELGLDLETQIGDAQELPYNDDEFDAVLLHLVLSVVPDPNKVVAETERVLDPDGRVSIFDKFVPEDENPSLLRRSLNPLTRFLFSDITHNLEPMFSDTDLDIEDRELFLGDIYTVTTARPTNGDYQQSMGDR